VNIIRQHRCNILIKILQVSCRKNTVKILFDAAIIDSIAI